MKAIDGMGTLAFLFLTQVPYLQALLHDSLSELFKAQPEDPLAFLISQLQAEQERRKATVQHASNNSSG